MLATIRNKAWFGGAEAVSVAEKPRKRYVSIKWKLLAICIFLVTVPTSFLGILGYSAFKAQTQKNTEILLSKITLEWHQVTDAYIDQINRVLRREEVLVQQRLRAIVDSTIKLLEYAEESSFENRERAQAIYDVREKLEEIEIGRSGFIFLADEYGKVLLSKDSAWQNRYLEDFLITGEPDKKLDLKEQVTSLPRGDFLVYRFATPTKDTGRVRYQLAVVGYFEPWNLVIGALTYLTDFKSYELKKQLQDQLRYKIAEQQIGDYGYSWVINSNGDYIVSHDRMRDGENIFHSRDEKGEYFIQDIITHARGLENGETFVKYYPWKNLGEPVPYRKVAAVTYVPEWDWIIGVSTYEKDYFKGLDKVRFQFLVICLLAIIFGSFIGYLFALLISRPIQALSHLSLEAAEGRLDVEVDNKIMKQSSEIGWLATSFQTMTTNLKHLIDEKEAFNEALLDKNAELATAKKQLENSVEMAEHLMQKANQANEAKSTFLANMSHELRTPLNVILGYAQLMSIDEEVSEKIRNDSRAILQSGDHLLMLINDILDIAKIEAKKLELVETEFDFLQFLEDISVMIELEASNKPITFIRSFAEKLPQQVRTDEKRLKQVLINLLNNAVKFTSEGRVTFEVEPQQTLESGDTKVNIKFSVKDTGRGIPQDAISKIFKPFEQVTSPGSVQGGTGLGLAISNEIVAKMGGHLEVESEVNLGSRFSFTLQLKPAQMIDEVESGYLHYTGYEGDIRDILVVDDIESNRLLIKNILETFRFRVAVAADGGEAINKINTSLPDLVILDLNMPEMDGYEVMLQVRQQFSREDLKIIVLSGNVGPDEQKRCRECGADGFLPKPVEIESLLAHLQKCLQLSWVNGTASSH